MEAYILTLSFILDLVKIVPLIGYKCEKILILICKHLIHSSLVSILVIYISPKFEQLTVNENEPVWN